jgi:hypothetical protein
VMSTALFSLFLGGCVAYVPAHRRVVVEHPRVVEVRPAPPPVIVVQPRRRYYYGGPSY